MNREFFFTYSGNSGVGFTDNLYQFHSLYKLANSIGGNYVYAPFESRRSAEGVFRFLGFDEGWNRRIDEEPYSGMPRLDVQFDERHRKATSFSKLQEYLAGLIDSEISENGKEFLVSLSMIGRSGYFHHVHAAIPGPPEEWRLLETYKSAREKDRLPAAFEDGKLRILYHIRQGDTAVVETPWKTFVPLWHAEGEQRFKELRSRDGLSAKYTHPERFLSFARMLCAELVDGSYSNVVSSDGYARAFRIMFECGAHTWKSFLADALVRRSGGCRPLRLSRRKSKLLRDWENDYEERVFKPFESLPGTNLLIGEEAEKLFRFLDAALRAHIIVVGTQQRMLLKFLSVYHDANEPKLVIVLSNSEKEIHYCRQVGLSPKVIQVLQLGPKSGERERLRDALEKLSVDAEWPLRLASRGILERMKGVDG